MLGLPLMDMFCFKIRRAKPRRDAHISIPARFELSTAQRLAQRDGDSSCQGFFASRAGYGDTTFDKLATAYFPNAFN